MVTFFQGETIQKVSSSFTGGLEDLDEFGNLPEVETTTAVPDVIINWRGSDSEKDLEQITDGTVITIYVHSNVQINDDDVFFIRGYYWMKDGMEKPWTPPFKQQFRNFNIQNIRKEVFLKLHRVTKNQEDADV